MIKKINRYLFFKLDVVFFFVCIHLKLYAFAVITNTTSFSSYLLSLANLVVICAFLLFFSVNIRIKAILFMNTILSFVSLSNIIYWRFFDDFISIAVLININQVGELGNSIFSLLKLQDVFLVIDIPIFWFFVRHYKRLYENRTEFKKVNCCYILLSIPVTCLLVFSSYFYMPPLLLENRYSNYAVIDNLGIINYYILDLYSNLASYNRYTVDEGQVAAVKSWLTKHHRNEKTDHYGNLYGLAKDKNIIMLQVESLQSFVVGRTEKQTAITPNINKLLNEGIYFENFFDQTNLGRTSDAEFMALTSLYSLENGSVYCKYPNNTFTSLPGILENQGYYPVSAHAFGGDFWNRSNMHRQLGFKKSWFRKDFVMEETVGWGISDASFYKQLVQKLKEQPQPFFAFAISLSNHHPYNESPEDYKIVSNNKKMINDYINSIHYTDFAVGELLKALKKEGLYEDSVIVLYGDHDAALPEGELAEYLNQPVSKLKAYDKVPLIIHMPGLKPIRVKENSGHIDLGPTLLYLAGLEQQPFFLGSNALNKRNHNLIILPQGTFINEDGIFSSENHTLTSGTYYHFQTNKNVNLQLKDDMVKEYSISQLMVKHNLIPRLQ